jgi:hypothetical protein
MLKHSSAWRGDFSAQVLWLESEGRITPISRGRQRRTTNEKGKRNAGSRGETQAASLTLDHSVHGPYNNHEPDCDDQGQGGAPVVANNSNIQERNSLRRGSYGKEDLRNEQQSQCHLCMPPQAEETAQELFDIETPAFWAELARLKTV